MIKIFTYTNNYIACEQEKKKEILQIITSLVRAKFLVNLIPLKYYYKAFANNANHKFDVQLYHEKYRLFKNIKKKVPLHFSCLEESLALRFFLQKHHAILPVFLGVKTEYEGNLSAHAWTQFEDFQIKKYKRINHYEIEVD